MELFGFVVLNIELRVSLFSRDISSGVTVGKCKYWLCSLKSQFPLEIYLHNLIFMELVVKIMLYAEIFLYTENNF